MFCHLKCLNLLKISHNIPNSHTYGLVFSNPPPPPPPLGKPITKAQCPMDQGVWDCSAHLSQDALCNWALVSTQPESAFLSGHHEERGFAIQASTTKFCGSRTPRVPPPPPPEHCTYNLYCFTPIVLRSCSEFVLESCFVFCFFCFTSSVLRYSQRELLF